MLLSIIIPVYNVQKYLERCINSVIHADRNNVEIIIVDDGSTDNSSAICDKYSNLYENVIVVHQKNGGLSSARNTGIEYSSGEFIAFLDSDDMYDKDFVNDIINIIRNHYPDMISFRCCYEKQEDEYKLDGNKSITIYNRIDYLKRIIQNKVGNQICFRVFKRKLFEELKFPLGCHYEDIRIFWEIVANTVKIVDIDYTYYVYNLTNENSITKDASVKSMNDMKVSVDIMIDGIMNVLQISGELNNELLKIVKYAKLNFYVYIVYKLKNNKDADKLKSELIKYIKQYNINLWKYRLFDWKKYVVCKLLIKLGRI